MEAPDSGRKPLPINLSNTDLHFGTGEENNNYFTKNCQFCDMSVAGKKGQILHRWFHTEEKPLYTCQFCEQGYDDFHLLQQHERDHYGAALENLAKKNKDTSTDQVEICPTDGKDQVDSVVAIKVEKEDILQVDKNSNIPLPNTNRRSPEVVTLDDDDDSLVIDDSIEGGQSVAVTVTIKNVHPQNAPQTPSSSSSISKLTKDVIEACSKCDEFFDSANTLQRDLRAVHSELAYYPCDHCGRIFLRKPSLRLHLETSHGVFCCNVCHQTIVGVEEFASHQKSHGPYYRPTSNPLNSSTLKRSEISGQQRQQPVQKRRTIYPKGQLPLFPFQSLVPYQSPRSLTQSSIPSNQNDVSVIKPPPPPYYGTRHTVIKSMTGFIPISPTSRSSQPCCVENNNYNHCRECLMMFSQNLPLRVSQTPQWSHPDPNRQGQVNNNYYRTSGRVGFDVRGYQLQQQQQSWTEPQYLQLPRQTPNFVKSSYWSQNNVI